jgi:hypothetical protein
VATFSDIQAILDRAIGGGEIGAHGAFWRGVTRDQFVAKSVYGLPVVTLRDGANSNIVKALKGQAPFGDDIGTPGATMPRMPDGMDPMPPADIATIQSWIDQGCPA